VIPSALITLIEDGVDAMATPSYNFNYGAVDVQPPEDTGLPLPYLDFPEEAGVPVPDSVVGRYTIDQPIAIRVLVPALDSVSIDEQCAKVANDIKELMNSLHDSLKAAGMSFADFTGVSKIYRLVRAYPAQVTVNFNIRFRQLKSNPGG
jgi:hypothetical protein